MQKISRDIAKRLLLAEKDGTIFSVVFIKKNGEKRRMICRKGVKKYLRGGELRYNPVYNGLLPVFDTEKNAYRNIDLDTIEQLKMHHNEFEVTDAL